MNRMTAAAKTMNAKAAAAAKADADAKLQPAATTHFFSQEDIFTPEVVSECQELFSMFDNDGGGSIDRDEFGQMMKTLGLNLNDRELDEFFAEMDEDGGGSVEFEEMLDMLKKISQHITPEMEFKEAFKFFDLDGSGEITNRELMRVVNTMGGDITLDMAEEMICSATGSDDGGIDFDTFKTFCQGGLPQDPNDQKKGALTRPRGYSMLLREMGSSSSLSLPMLPALVAKQS